jgi:hypothetical protein
MTVIAAPTIRENPRAESIERHAEGNLHGRERQKEDAGQETDLSR